MSIRKPTEPQRTYNGKIQIETGYSGCLSLEDILTAVVKNGKDIDYNKIMFECYDDYGSNCISVYYWGDIENISYDKDMIEYNKQLQEYNDWIEFKESKNKKGPENNPDPK